MIDTGVLLRAFDREAIEHPIILRAIRILLNRGDRFAVSVQNMAEFWNVSTRQKNTRGGLELPVEVVSRRIRVIEKFCSILTESALSFDHWKRLVGSLLVCGAKVHDARLVSVMLASDISTLITLNEQDFKRYSEVVAVSPGSLEFLAAS